MDTPSPFVPARSAIRASILRRLSWTGSALAVVLLAGAILWLAQPLAGPLASTGTPLERLLGGPNPATSLAAAGLLAASAATTLVIGVRTLAGRAAGALSPVVVVLAAICPMLGLLGLDAVVIVGYSLAFLLPIGVIALIVVLAARRPATAIVLALLVAAVLTLAALGVVPLFEPYAMYASAVAREPIRFAATLALTAFAGVWTLWAAALLTRRLPSWGAFVARHRVGITIAAAACAAPYAIARASWFTPWPLFGGNEDLFTAHPEARVVGLLLGAAMLAGGVLTLGLILPWGSRVPRWVPVVGGRPVPAAVAVVPAVTVSLLFTTGGTHALALALEGTLPLATALMLPFWLWGPLLGLAAWGYAEHRRRWPADEAAGDGWARPHPPERGRLPLGGGAAPGPAPQSGAMTHLPRTEVSSPTSGAGETESRDRRVRSDRLTVAAAFSLLVISVLHTLVFALHPWWGPWLAGPFRTEQLPAEAAVQFWGLPGGFVMPGVLLALLILDAGRRGRTVPIYVGLVLGLWALICVWMVGPSGFLLLLVPAGLLLSARVRSTRRARSSGR